MLNCHKCNKTLDDDKGVWAYHDDLPPKTDLAICARCWWFDKDPKLHFNGNLGEDYNVHYPSIFHDHVDTTIWAGTPILYRKGDVIEVKIVDKKDNDNLDILGIVTDALLGDKESENI